jgi:hypothetical protein
MWSANVVGQGWMPLTSDSQEIEQAFQRQDDMISIRDPATGSTNHYMFQSMLQINASDQCHILRSTDTTNLSSSFHPWQFESDPKTYSQMNPHYSELLTMARKRGNKQLLIHDYATYDTKLFDLTAMTQINKTTNTMRQIIPAPGDPAKPFKLTDDVVVPSEFKCPISHDIMVDPVVAADGHTYERYYYERWVSGGKIVSPLTNLPLNSITAIPNLNLKKLISHFVSDNTSSKGKKKRKKQ